MNIGNSQKSVFEIFQSMESEDESDKISVSEVATGNLSENDEEENLNGNIIKSIKEAQKKWINSASEEKRLEFIDNLYKLLRENFQLGANYLKFNREFLLDDKKSSIILLIFDEYYLSIPLLCGIVLSTLLYNNAIIVEPAKKELLKFRDLLIKSGLPEKMFTVVSHLSYADEMEEISNIIYVGDKIKAVSLYKKHLYQSFSFIGTYKTSVLLLESCDLHSATEQIFRSTWGKGSDALWGVSTIVVQESIFEEFVRQCKFHLNNFTYDKHNPKFQNQNLLQQVEDLIQKARKAGATILQKDDSEELTWSPKFLLNYYNLNHETFGGVICVMICRTPKEGISMLNNNSSIASISIWTEIYPQALEVASMSIGNHISVNCFGNMSPNIPFYFSNLVIGGVNGFQSKKFVQHGNKKESKRYSKEWIISESIFNSVFNVVASAQKSYNFWTLNKDKRLLLQNVVNSLKGTDAVCKDISRIIHDTKNFICDDDYFDNHYVIQKLVPIGIIVIYLVKDSMVKPINQFFFQILFQALLNGNVIIVVTYPNREFKYVFDIITKNLPKNVFQVIQEENPEHITFLLAGNPNIQDIWTFGTDDVADEVFMGLKNFETSMNKTFKNLQDHRENNMTSKIKAIWLPKVDQAP